MDLLLFMPKICFWSIKTSDYHSTYYGTAVGNGGIGILPWKEPFSVKQVVLNHVV